mgnify:CR=1 FL=1
MNKEVQYEYIINNCIETCNYIGEFKTEREKIWLVLAEFLNYSKTKNLNKIRNLGEEIGEWLRGLPLLYRRLCRLQYCSNREKVGIL